MSGTHLRTGILARSLLLIALATGLPGGFGDVAAAARAGGDALAPEVDHHQHLLSPRGAQLLNSPQNAVELPAGVAAVLRHHEESWNDPKRLARIYSTEAIVLDVDDEVWLRGSDAAAPRAGRAPCRCAPGRR